MRKAFALSKPVKRATAYVCGLAYYELYLDGKKVGDRVLEPPFTDYTKSALYSTYDVTEQLQKGEHAVGIMLGSGFLNAPSRDAWDFQRAPWRDLPMARVMLVVEFADGTMKTIGSDSSWKLGTGAITWDTGRQGEKYDARLEVPGWATAAFDDTKWPAPQELKGPKGVLRANMAYPCRVTETIKPIGIKEVKPGVYVLDLGQNIAGWVRMRVSGPKGATVKLKYAEKIHPDGSLDQSNLNFFMYDPFFQDNEYTLKGEGVETYEPRFAYNGFQWVEITGWPGVPELEVFEGRVVHNDFKPAGSFECSNKLFNDIQRLTLWSYRGNYVGIPTDCPHREKNGWTGDAHLAAEQALFNWHNAASYTKWMDDMRDAQKPNGDLPGIVPSGGWGFGIGPAWDSAYPLICWYLYEYEGDLGILAKHYDRLNLYMDGLEKKSDKLIPRFGLGDWVPAKTATPETITATGYFYVDALVMSKTAKLLGKKDDAVRYAELAEKVKAAFHKEFVKPDGVIGTDTQCALATAVFQGLVEGELRNKVVERLAANVKSQGNHLDGGILDAKYLFDVLSENGHHDLANAIANQKDYPSYGLWLEKGATTLWESWQGEDSRNHIMFGDISAWFYKQLAGIRPDPEHPGFRHFVLKPRLTPGIDWVKAHHDGPYGRIVSEWKLEGGFMRWHVVVPPGSSATVFFPADLSRVSEGGKALVKGSGQGLEFESGEYNFEIKL